MKNIKIISKLFLATLMFFACIAEEPGELDPSLHNPDIIIPPISAGVLSAKIDGTDFISDFTTAVVDNSMITIQGKVGSSIVSLRFPENITAIGGGTLYPLEGNATPYSANYNTAINVLSTSTTESPMQLEFDGQNWSSDNEVFSILSGVSDLKGITGAAGESVHIVLETDVTGLYAFGPITTGSTTIHTINYREPGAGALVWNADTIDVNGNMDLNVDAVNKLVSGTFSFDGIKTNIIGTAPSYGTIDTDGDGVVDLKENELSTDVADANDPIQTEGYTGYNATNMVWMAADGDFDGVNNGDEL